MQVYKEPRVCDCGYIAIHRSNWSTHKKRCRVHTSIDPEKDQLRERVASLEHQLTTREEYITSLEQQLLAKEERNAALEQMLGHQLLEVKEELKQTKKRKDRYADVAATRRPLTEPERRKIAQAQGWRCADPDGECLLPGEIQEYDIDHVIPIWKGGQDEPENLQALCPACHRRKTNRERLERSTGTLSKVATPGP